MRFVENYRGWEIVDSEAGYYLIIEQDSYDYEQVPFPTMKEAKNIIDAHIDGQKLLTAEEADQAYEESPEVPISPEEVRSIVKRARDATNN